MQKNTYTATRLDEMARNFVESLGALKTESNQYILGRKGQAQHGRFDISYEKGVCLDSGIPIYAYAGIQIRHDGKTVYNRHGDSVERVRGKWETELEALPSRIAKAPAKRKAPRRRTASVSR